MAAGGKNGWKIFGIIVIVAVIVLLAFLIGRGCERKNQNEGTTTSTQTQPPAATTFSSPETGVVPEQPGVPAEVPPVNEEEGVPTVVSSKDTVGPCVGGFREVVHYTEYSNGTAASSVSREACTVEEEPPIAPVP
jgi:hypothetical protein